MRSAGLRDLAYLAESRSYDVCVPIKLTSKRTFNLSLMCQLRTIRHCSKTPHYLITYSARLCGGGWKSPELEICRPLATTAAARQ